MSDMVITGLAADFADRKYGACKKALADK